MFENLFQLFKIGKELGLNKKEIRNILLFDNTKNPTLYTILMIIGIILSGIVIIFIVIVIVRNAYPAGALYSTVKTKDFKDKSNK